MAIAKYDSGVIYTFADRLYSQAASIVGMYTIIGGIVGLAAGYIPTQNGTTAVILGAIVAGIGAWLGTQKAFALKLQAQIALCQVQIEENTRGGARGGAMSSASSSSRSAV